MFEWTVIQTGVKTDSYAGEKALIQTNGQTEKLIGIQVNRHLYR
jgi:hypothetical protein